MDGLGGRLSPQMWDCMQGGGYREPHFFTLADADYVESVIVQWRQRVNESISYFCMGCARKRVQRVCEELARKQYYL